jgi:hypothetical protein
MKNYFIYFNLVSYDSLSQTTINFIGIKHRIEKFYVSNDAKMKNVDKIWRMTVLVFWDCLNFYPTIFCYFLQIFNEANYFMFCQ